jgi:hypothetical protein
MDERRALRDFRADVPAPDPAVREQARAKLLAVVEPPRRRLSRRKALALAFAVAAVLTAAAVLAAGLIGRDRKDEALAGLPEGPILHAVLEVPLQELSSDSGSAHVVNLDLATGRMRPVLAQTELWYDARLRRLRQVDRVNGALVFEALETRRGTIDSVGSHDTEPATIESGLGAFFEGYKRALHDRSVRVLRTAIVGGRRVRWLRFPPKPGRYADEVAVDPKTAKPLFIRHVCPDCVSATTYRIVTLEGVREGAVRFSRPVRRGLHQVGRTKSVVENVSRRQAGTALGSGMLWPGDAVGSLRLTTIQLNRVAVRLAPPGSSQATTFRRTGLTFYYGGRLNRWGHMRFPRGEPYVTVAEATAAGVWFNGFHIDVFGGRPVGAPSRAALPRIGEALMSWTGAGPYIVQLLARGRYLEIDSSSRALALAAARSLRPIQK